MPAFNALLRDLRDEVETACPGGARATPPPWARAAMVEAHARCPAELLAEAPAGPETILAKAQHASHQVALAGRNNGCPAVAAAAVLAQLPSLSDRLAVIECAGCHGLGMLQYIDDGVAACPSAGATRAILDQSIPPPR